MPPNEATPKQKILVQILLLLTGTTLIMSRHLWGKPLPVLLAGVFFLNLCWITLVLGHDLKIWSWLRNTLTGNLLMIAFIISNLMAIVAATILS